MKKRSFSLGEGDIKQLAAQHVEKVIFACLVLVGLSLIYFAFKQKSSSEEMVPTNLIGEAKKASEFIHRDTWKENAERFSVSLNIVPQVEKGLGEKIDGMEYVVGEATLNKGERMQLTKRTDPTLLAAFDLQAKGMFGTVPTKAASDIFTRLNKLEYGSPRVVETNTRKKEDDEDTTADAGIAVGPQAGAEAGGGGVLTKIQSAIEREMDGVRPVGADAAKAGMPGGYIICVTGLVPFRQQIIEFQKLRSTEGSNPETDYPWYAKLEVERMDLDAATPQFVDITDKVNKYSENVATNFPEVCVPECYDPKLALKILPFLRHDPRQLAIHPLIPAKKWIEDEAVEEEKPEEEPRSAFDLTAKGGTGTDSAQDKMRNTMNPEMMGMTQIGGASKDQVNVILEPEKAPEFKLVRFFDLVMEPGKRYQYRVRLRLYDPNLPGSMVRPSSGTDEVAGSTAAVPGAGGMEEMMKKMAEAQGNASQGSDMSKPAIVVVHGNKRVRESMLDDSVRRRLRELAASEDFASTDEDVRYGIPTEWSEPSNEIVTPGGSETYFAGTATLDKEREAKGVKFYQSEPTAELAISVWDPHYMYYIPGLAQVNRGTTLHLKQVVKLIHPIDLTIREIRGEKIKATGRMKEDTYAGHEIDSQAVVIDISGGVKLPNKTRSSTDFYTPGEILVFDGESFSVQDELQDKRLFRENSLYEVEEEETSSTRPSAGPALDNIFGG